MRDKITFNDAFLAELKAEIASKSIAAGSKLLIVARTINHMWNYSLRLENYNLLIAADEYDAERGSIDVSGHDGATSAKGAAGAKGCASAGQASNKPGGNGGNGGAGGQGTNGCGPGRWQVHRAGRHQWR